ncbi:D-alanyl-D-alanine carboxypeptidase PBP6B [Acinetobacter shaoyimingii]|uniref:D-alanyl-D-alanine carboxypeptidase PBP6B n=1 Tax=Acinetobacter shaoyimingii TaxID=2715164 RepID=UPI001D0EA3E2|nr:D-alanyl-D-alanine carboxypeptidase PBP6B [Acinetobacter shaoyimingii]
MKIFTLVTLCLSIFCSTLVNAALLNIDPMTVEAEAFTILDPQSGQVIAESNSHVQRAPASLTKMMVAYITLKEIQAGHLNKNEILTATPVVKMVQWDESQMYLKPGEQISIDQLLAGLVVMSANDAAVTLAERISGTVPAFVARMNKEAQALGMKDTHFANPPGITMDDHYSTAHDLALLGQALVKQTPDYLNYSKQQSFVYNQRFHRATNILLKQDSSVDGLKTGFTRAAGFNLALTAARPSNSMDVPNRRLIVVVLGAKSGLKRAEMAHKLLNVAYNYTRDEIAIKDKQLIAELPVVKSTLKMFKVEAKKPQIITTSLYAPNAIIDLTKFDNALQRVAQVDAYGLTTYVEPLQQTQTRMDVELSTQSLTAPMKQMIQLAKVNVYQNNQLIQTLTIQDDVDIEEASWFERLISWFKNLIPFSSSHSEQAKTYPL